MNTPAQDQAFFATASQHASKVFMPASPIMSADLFAGRLSQLQKVLDAINQPGLHAIVYGERGVGKTSLANVLAPLARAVQGNLVSAKVNCDATDTFESACRKALSELKWVVERQGAGFTGDVQKEVCSLADRLPSPCSPNDLRMLLGSISLPIMIIFDEFDRLPAKATKVFTDLIKALSDYAVNTTVVMVGVADTVDKLIRDHASIERALVQIPMPRMEPSELRQILTKGALLLGIAFDESAASQTVQISQGLPHYTHLIALHAARSALGEASLMVRDEDVGHGMDQAVENAQQSIKSQYHRATTSSHKSALFEQVLLACALAKKDQLAYFRASDVEHPLSAIMGGKYDVPAFARHLSEFCSETRGPVLERIGAPRRFRYRFSDPLLEPFVVINARARNLISADKLAELSRK
jgi:Cdc6-like AAA superfamily ATPase